MKNTFRFLLAVSGLSLLFIGILVLGQVIARQSLIQSQQETLLNECVNPNDLAWVCKRYEISSQEASESAVASASAIVQ